MPTTYDNVFHRVSVDYLVDGGARITWDLQPFFWEPGAYRFQLQVGDTANPAADDWEDVGVEITDQLLATDDDRRTEGKWRFPHYRVRLVTDAAEYFSAPTPAAGRLNHRDWCTARAVVRRERQHQRLSGAWTGYLLKRKWRGTEPDPHDLDTAVRDAITGDIIDTQQEVTYGAPFVGGYYAPLAMAIELTGTPRYIEQDPELTGTGSQMEIRGRALAIPELQHMDVFVHTGSDRRYEVHQVYETASPWGFPLVVEAALRLLPATHIVYKVPLT